MQHRGRLATPGRSHGPTARHVPMRSRVLALPTIQPMTRTARWIPSLLALAMVPTLSSAQTTVTGPTNGVWDLAGSPYLLVGDVSVYAGSTLTIEPGVEVLGQDGLRVDIRPLGRLVAVGTPERPIHFKAADPAEGWRGVRLDRAAQGTHLKHCIIESAHGRGSFTECRGGALHVLSCSPLVEDCEMRGCSSLNANRNGAGAGILIESSDGTFLRNHVHHNEADSGGGICVAEYGTPYIAGNLVTDNSANSGGGGFYFGARSSPVLEGNRILRNHADGSGGGGVNSWTAFALFGTFATLRNNVIAFNTASTSGGGAYMRYDRLVSDNDLYAFNGAPRGAGRHALLQFVAR